jgi:hypothetical protein
MVVGAVVGYSKVCVLVSHRALQLRGDSSRARAHRVLFRIPSRGTRVGTKRRRGLARWQLALRLWLGWFDSVIAQCAMHGKRASALHVSEWCEGNRGV